MGYGKLKPEDVEIGRLYIIPIEVGANPPALLVTRVLSKDEERFISQSLDGKIQHTDLYEAPRGILLKEFNGKYDFLMGRQLLEQIVRANMHS